MAVKKSDKICSLYRGSSILPNTGASTRTTDWMRFMAAESDLVDHQTMAAPRQRELMTRRLEMPTSYAQQALDSSRLR